MKIKVFTDGGCKKDNKGGYAFVIIKDDKNVYEESKLFDNTTNNQMELLSIISCLKYLKSSEYENEEIEIISDSQYCVNGLNTWVHGWKKNNWKKADKKPVLNSDLWRELDTLFYSFPNISLNWQLGHQNNGGWNDYVDQLYNDTFLETNPKKVKVNPEELAIEFAEWLIDNGIVTYVGVGLSNWYKDFKKYKDEGIKI